MRRSRVTRALSVAAGSLTAALMVGVPATAASAASLSAGNGATSPAASGTRAVQAAPRVPHGAQALGALSSSAAVSGAVVLKPRDEASVQAFIAAVTDKKSPEYHHFLAPGAYAARFGPTLATIASVRSTLASEGLSVTGVASDGLVVHFTGTAAHVESAFHTGITRYRLADGTTGQATTSAVQLPATIASSVSSVVGLDQLTHLHPSDIRRATTSSASGTHVAAKPATFTHPAGSPTACADATSAASQFGGLTDDQIAHAYGAFGLYNQGDFGSGQHIGVFELEPFSPSDLRAFDTCYYGATAAASMAGRVSVVPVDGGQPAGPGSGEAILDVEDVAGMAPGANIDVYEAPNTTFGALDEFSQMINNTSGPLDKVITTSWGLCEQAVQAGEPGVQQAENVLFEQAAAQGQSVFSAAGDTGSNDCNANRTTTPVSPILSVDDPSSQPYVTAVGGTTIDAATQPPAEHVWNDGAEWGAGGGGISQAWPMPIWQLGSLVPGINSSTNVSAANTFEQSELNNPSYQFCQTSPSNRAFETACRELPDVTAQADEFTGAITIYDSSYGGWLTIGGTSSATPIWAGLLALINTSATSPSCPAAQDQGVGFVNPLLYAVASNPAADAASFHDITAGNNDPYGDSHLFPATTGYDMASGLGSPELTSAGGGEGLAWYLCNYVAAASRPTITSLSPNFGPTSPNTAVTITGTGFEDAAGHPVVTGVQVGTFQLPTGIGWSVTSPTTISAELPPTSSFLLPPTDPTDGAGAYQITVTVNDGETTAAGPNSVFSYVNEASGTPVPTVTSVRTYGGPEAGGNAVDIFGSGFTGATGVTFGGVAGTGLTTVSDSHIRVTVPPYAAGTTVCAQDGSSYGTGETATNDICQVQVAVTGPGGTSATSTILPLYEGAISFNSEGVLTAPAGEEAAPQPTEYDYVPAPTITTVSTNDGKPGDLASEVGGSLVTVKGTGFNLATLDWLDVGDPAQQASQNYYNLAFVSGTEMQFSAPATADMTVDQMAQSISVKTLAGQSDPAASSITYAGVPTVTSVAASSGPTAFEPAGPDTGGTPIALTGSGFSGQVIGVQYMDAFSPFSFGTQYSYSSQSDTSLDTATVPQNPAIVDVLACTVTGCSAAASQASPPSDADTFILYPPGAPKVESLSVSSGPATGGNQVTITGENLGCATAVDFGSTPAATFTNQQAILDCGSTTTVTVTAPPGTIGSRVPVKVSTLESDFAHDTPQTAASYTYLASKPVFTADTPPSIADRGRPYSYTFTASAAPAPTFAVASGSLPVGLVLDRTTGVLSGTPVAAGTFHFVIRATNSAGTAYTPTLAITVEVKTTDTGYRLFGADGSVYGFGSEGSKGSAAGIHLAKPIVGGATTPDGGGYWLVAADGGVFTFGDAHFHGSAGSLPLVKPIVGMAATPDGGGYWLVASDGGVFTFGDAHFYGSAGSLPLKKPVVGMASTPDGHGYWLVASDGGIFCFGDAHFEGSAGSLPLVKPIIGMAPTLDGHGYWLAASDGGIFTFGDAHFHGSLGGQNLVSPVVGVQATPDGLGYGLVSGNGEVSPFGDFVGFGSTANRTIPAPIVGFSL